MADNQVTLEINVETKDAQAAIELFGKDSVKIINKTEKSVESLDDGFKSFKKSLAPIAVGIGSIVAAFRTFDDAIREVNEDVKELKQIRFALQATDEATDGAVEGIVAFANSLREATAVDDGLIRNLFIQAKAFGTSTEQAKELTKAAIDLSAATGQSVEAALKQLGMTLDGTAGRINNLGADFRNLSDEQLKNGAAIDLVNKKYGGAAAAGLDTFEGASNQLSNSIRDLLTEIGRLITENAAFVNSLKAVSSAIQSTISGMNAIGKFFNPRSEDADTKKYQELIRKRIDSMELLGNASLAAAPKLKSLVEVLNESGGRSTEEFKTFGETLNRVQAEAVKSTGLTGKAAEDSRKKFEALRKEIINAGETEIAIAARIRDERLAILNEVNQGGQITAKEYATERTKIELDLQKVISKVQKDALEDQKKLQKESQEAAEKAAEKAVEAYKGSFEKIKSGVDELQKAYDEQGKTYTEMIALELQRAAISADNAKKELQILGKQSDATDEVIRKYLELAQIKAKEAKKDLSKQTTGELVTGLGESLSSLFSSGKVGQSIISTFNIGAELIMRAAPVLQAAFEEGIRFVSGQRFEQLFQISESIGNLPKSLLSIFENFSEIFSSILEKLPEAISKLIDELPKLAENLANSLGSVLEKVFQKLPEIFQSLLKAFSSIISVLFEKAIPALIDALPGIVEAIAEALPGLFETILKALPNIITKIFEAIPKIIRSIIDAIPAIVEVLADNIGPIVEALVEGIVSAAGEIVAGLIDSLLIEGGLERIVGAIIRAIPRIAIALVVGIAKGLGSAALSIGHVIGKGFLAIGGNFAKTFAGSFEGIKTFFSNFLENFRNLFSNIGPALGQAFQNIGTAIVEAIQRGLSTVFEPLIDAMKPLTDAIAFLADKVQDAGGVFGKGGGKGLASETLGRIGTGNKGFKFAEGGIVPNIGLGLGDTVPMFMPGELIVPTDLVGQLASFLANQDSGSSNGQSNAILMGILQAVQQPITVNAQAKVNQSAFADIILQLNRQNARLSA